MRGKSQLKEQIKAKIAIQTSGTITDTQYNLNGTQLAVSDSDGFVYIYHRTGDTFTKTSQFRGDEAAIWKISWADPLYGDVIAIGSFKRKVAVFQGKNNTWTEVAYHQLHEGSVNHVEWASAAFGLKLFSGGSEGSIAILEFKKNSWSQASFCAHECSLNSLSVRPLALNEDEQQRSNAYPMLASVAKDNTVKIWVHTNDIPEQELQAESRIYQQVASFKPHKEAIRSLLWKKRWTEAAPIEYELFTSSEDGTVKLSAFVQHELKQTIQICEYQAPVYKLSQSLTGNMLSVSVGNESEKSYLYGEKEEWNNWVLLEELK